VRLAVGDMTDAGIDVVSDGEQRRESYFNQFATAMDGLDLERPGTAIARTGRPTPVPRVVGPIRRARSVLAGDMRFLRSITQRRIKVTIPGPFTLSGRLATGRVYPDRVAAAEAFIPLLAAEIRALAEAGATFIQIDEPSPAIHPDAPADFAGLFNAVVADVPSSVRLGAHLCFGNYMGRPLARRTYRPVLDQLQGFRVKELVLEFANRELAELDLLEDLTDRFDIAAGIIDVKNSYVETPDDVAERIDRVLEHVPAERLSLVPDCGFSQTARPVAKAKLRALVAGRDLVLGRRTV
jgi:5-methyltetrahydropteroyltriglutamate--homocysteine methyltransferase